MHDIDHENGLINNFESETGLEYLILAKNAPNSGFLEPNLSSRPKKYSYNTCSVTLKDVSQQISQFKL